MEMELVLRVRLESIFRPQILALPVTLGIRLRQARLGLVLSQRVCVRLDMVARALMMLVLHVRFRRSRMLVETRFALAVQ